MSWYLVGHSLFQQLGNRRTDSTIPKRIQNGALIRIQPDAPHVPVGRGCAFVPHQDLRRGDASRLKGYGRAFVT